MRFPRPLLALILMLLSPLALAGPPELPRGRGDTCVEPTDVMRKQHMDFLLHQRDRTVHQGIRTRQHSLVECVDCYVQKNDSGEYIPVDAPEQFCEACHTYVSAKLDCFECHATTPDGPADAATQALLDAAESYGVMSFGGFSFHRPGGVVDHE